MTRKVRTYTLRLPRATTAEGQREASLATVLKPGKGWDVATLMAEWHRVQEEKVAAAPASLLSEKSSRRRRRI
jgi:hypothetical protein